MITGKPLFIFEMANNHCGDVRHGLRIIGEFKKIAEKYFDRFDFAFKLQLRDPSIIHPDFADRMDLNQIKRFTETRLSGGDFALLKAEIEKQGFISMCTPFDEPSVDKMLEMGFAVFKIASCSIGDWPLMERFEKVDKPVIISTACADVNRLDNVVSFFLNRKKNFAIMHCVSAYPTENKDLEINQINYLKNRYAGIRTGFSTHEVPDNDKSIFMAIAAGASIFEKHVGVPTEKYKLNGYSCTPLQIDSWLEAACEAYDMLGGSEGRMGFTESAVKGVGAFVRGSFALRDIKKGETFSARDLFLAIPNVEKQLMSFDLSKYAAFTAAEDINKNAPVLLDRISVNNSKDRIMKIAKSVLAMLDKANIKLPGEVNCSVSAHYGLDSFAEYGATIIDVINREYCKKLMVMHPGQKHPSHTHMKKEETFHVLYGDLQVILDGIEHNLKAGDLLTVGRGQNHSFSTKDGVIFEEISTTHYKNDSFYDDNSIMNFSDRKIEFRLYS
jgi:sialic acid synthase SpsE/quercetin dioxygenase-like cupin family protein